MGIDHVRPLVRQALTGDGGGTLQLEAVNRRGRAISVRVACSPLTGATKEATGAIIVMETDGSTG